MRGTVRLLCCVVCFTAANFSSIVYGDTLEKVIQKSSTLQQEQKNLNYKVYYSTRKHLIDSPYVQEVRFYGVTEEAKIETIRTELQSYCDQNDRLAYLLVEFYEKENLVRVGNTTRRKEERLIEMFKLKGKKS